MIDETYKLFKIEHHTEALATLDAQIRKGIPIGMVNTVDDVLIMINAMVLDGKSRIKQIKENMKCEKHCLNERKTK